MGKVHEVNSATARRMLKELGSTQADNWDLKTLASRLKKLPGKLEGMNGDAKTQDLSKKSAACLDEIKDAVENNLKIKITGEDADDGDEDAAPKKRGRVKKERATKKKTGRRAKAEKEEKVTKKTRGAKKGRTSKAEKKEREPRSGAQMILLKQLARKPSMDQEALAAYAKKKGLKCSDGTIGWARRAFQQVTDALREIGQIK